MTCFEDRGYSSQIDAVYSRTYLANSQLQSHSSKVLILYAAATCARLFFICVLFAQVCTWRRPDIFLLYRAACEASSLHSLIIATLVVRVKPPRTAHNRDSPLKFKSSVTSHPAVSAHPVIVPQ